EGLAIMSNTSLGRGIITTHKFQKGDVVCDYFGKVVKLGAHHDHRRVTLERTTYCFYFEFKEQKYMIDASQDDGSYGRLINHSLTPNLKPVKVHMEAWLVFKAKRDINVGEELSFDYAD
ncbi:hypothetical protein CAPTEDRAFT_49838, partial [Capitella teleta]